MEKKGSFSCVLFSELVIFNGCFSKGGCDHDASRTAMWNFLPLGVLLLPKQQRRA